MKETNNDSLDGNKVDEAERFRLPMFLVSVYGDKKSVVIMPMVRVALVKRFPTSPCENLK